jgi:hypothetical protein
MKLLLLFVALLLGFVGGNALGYANGEAAGWRHGRAAERSAITKPHEPYRLPGRDGFKLSI